MRSRGFQFAGLLSLPGVVCLGGPVGGRGRAGPVGCRVAGFSGRGPAAGLAARCEFPASRPGARGKFCPPGVFSSSCPAPGPIRSPGLGTGGNVSLLIGVVWVGGVVVVPCRWKLSRRDCRVASRMGGHWIWLSVWCRASQSLCPFFSWRMTRTPGDTMVLLVVVADRAGSFPLHPCARWVDCSGCGCWLAPWRSPDAACPVVQGINDRGYGNCTAGWLR